MKRIIIFIITVIVLVTIVLIFAVNGKKDDKQVPKMERKITTAVLPPGVMDGMYKKPKLDDLKKMLTPLQFQVTQNNGTERAFDNIYWDNHDKGIYVDIVSGEPLFSSTDKYESNTGWPSFFKPLEEGNVVNVTDNSYGMVRIEVRSYYADSHLGHLFDDGPAPTGLRYCINSASLRFIPEDKMEKRGMIIIFTSLKNKFIRGGKNENY